MRICLVNSFFPPWRGGAETYAYNLAKQLAKKGHNVEAFCASPPRQPGSYDLEDIKLNCLPVTAWLYGTPIMTSLPSRLLRAQPDVIHAGFPSPYNAFSTALLCSLKGTASILTWHNDLPPVTSAARLLVYTHDRLVLPAYIQTFKRIISTSHRYAASSPTLKRYLRKVEIVPNGVDCERFRPDIDPQPVKQSLKLGDEKAILFVGALSKWHRYKGLDILLRAFALTSKERKDIALIVVGDGTMKPAYQKLTSDLGLWEKVRFVGDISDQDLPSYYAASDLLVLPSKDRSEGFGLTILEANACGKPAIGSAVGGIPDVIRHEFNGLLVPPNDPEALSTAITRLIGDNSLRTWTGRNGRKFAIERDWSRVAEETERVYQEALEHI